MKNLDQLIDQKEVIEIIGERNKVIKGITNDSRKVSDGIVFFAIKGQQFDGYQYIDQAIKLGAEVIVTERLPTELKEGVTYVKCNNVRRAYALGSSLFFNEPSQKMKIIGVTGTNGKSTVCSLLYNLFKEMGFRVGLISTIDVRIHDRVLSSQMTTPDAFVLQSYFADMYESGVQYAFMEVSSHAIHQDRILGVNFDVAVFTNISHDHLDYHKTFKEYIAAKKRFFDLLPSSAVAIVNIDDRNGSVMVQNTEAMIRRYSLYDLVDYKARILSRDRYGTTAEFNGVQFISPILGDYNVYNLLAVYAVVMELTEEEPAVIIEYLSKLSAVEGRLEIVHYKPLVVVDYAHTPDALENVLKTLDHVVQGHKIVTVVGCGGDRDKSKRPMMTKSACRWSNIVILTSDNPRSEDPNTIIEEMKQGAAEEEMKKIIEIVDRKMAIKTALALAHGSDVVLIAGKGHEEYQEINGVKYPFSDRQHVQELVKKDI